MKHIVTLILVTVVFAANVIAATITVTTNADSGTGSLREAIQNATNGDIIKFDSPYTIYLKDQLNLGGVNITIDGAVGDQKVRLDGGWVDTDNNWENDDTYTRVIEVTSSGKNGDGNAIDITLKNLIIQNASTDNDGWGGAWAATPIGAGMLVDMTAGGELYVDNCNFENNVLRSVVSTTFISGTSGAGVHAKGGVFTNCTFKNNTIYCQSKETRYSNITMATGAAANVSKGSKLINCRVVGNGIEVDPANDKAAYIIYGGGLLAGEVEIQSCVILGNYIKKSNSTFNPSIVANSGGIQSQSCKLLNSTIANNGIYNITPKQVEDVKYGGVGIIKVTGSTYKMDFQNCLVYGNVSSGTYNDCYAAPEHAKYIAISDADDYNNTSSSNGCIRLGESPFIQDPSSGTDGIWGTGDDNYGDLRLKKGSVCINAGNPNTSEFEYSDKDIYGRERIYGGTIDIGASESDVSGFAYTLSGAVWAGGNSFTEGKVYAMSKSAPTVKIAECTIKKDGSFELSISSDGEYYLLAQSSNSEYASTYFGNERDISKAIAIDVNSSIKDIDITMVKDGSTSVDGTDGSKFKIYPNPVNDVLYLQGINENATVSIYDSVGVLVLQKKSVNINWIPVQNLKNGVYIIAVKYNNAHKSLKFIKR